MTQPDNNTEISALVDELCGMLRRWSAEPDSLPIGDIDKAASTLKKLQDIRIAEESQTGDQSRTVVVTHHVPRAEEMADAPECPAEGEEAEPV